MKNKTVFLLLIALTVLVFSTATVMASPLDPDAAAKPTHEAKPEGKAPGAPASVQEKHELQAAEKAEDRELRQEEKALKQADKALQHPGQKLHFKGTIAGVTATTLDLIVGDGTTERFNLTPESIIKIPTLGLTATWLDLLPGFKANVQAVQDAPGQDPAVQDPAAQPAPTMTVVKVLVIPGKPIKTHRVGVVTAYTAGSSITIEEKDHKLYTYVLTPTTAILPPELAGQLAVGARVTVVLVTDPLGGPGTAIAIVVHPLTPCDVTDPALDPAADPAAPVTCPPAAPEPEPEPVE